MTRFALALAALLIAGNSSAHAWCFTADCELHRGARAAGLAVYADPDADAKRDADIARNRPNMPVFGVDPRRALAKAADKQAWLAYCKPGIMTDGTGAQRYVYAHAGCEDGRFQD